MSSFSRDLFDIHNRQRHPRGILKTEETDVETLAGPSVPIFARALARLRAGMILLTPGAPVFWTARGGKRMFQRPRNVVPKAAERPKPGAFCAKSAGFWTKGAGFWAESKKFYVCRVSAKSFLRVRAYGAILIML